MSQKKIVLHYSVNWIKQWRITLADWYPDIMFIKINKFNDARDKVNRPIKECAKQ